LFGNKIVYVIYLSFFFSGEISPPPPPPPPTEGFEISWGWGGFCNFQRGGNLLINPFHG